jgi:hypothetical protein
MASINTNFSMLITFCIIRQAPIITEKNGYIVDPIVQIIFIFKIPKVSGAALTMGLF